MHLKQKVNDEFAPKFTVFDENEASLKSKKEKQVNLSLDIGENSFEKELKDKNLRDSTKKLKWLKQQIKNPNNQEGEQKQQL